MMPISPTPTLELIGALIFLVGALVFVVGVLVGTLVGAALTARQTREEPRGGGSNSTGENGMRNETQHPLQLQPPSPQSMERENPSGGLRDLEDARVEGGGGENGGGGGEGLGKYWIILIVLFAKLMIITVMIMNSMIGPEVSIPALLALSLSFGMIYVQHL